MSKPATPRLRVGSLFSGYGGLDLAVEQVFDARTVWFSEINEPVARVFARHWPTVPNLGDITTIDWNTVEPVDILCGGFPCQDVSTVGKRAGLAPGTRSGLWAHMAAAIDTLQPEFVVIENVRGLLSSPAVRAPLKGDNDERRNRNRATVRNVEPDQWGLADQPARPLRAAGAVLGDLADLRMDAEWVGLPASLVGAPHPRLRIFILAHRHDAFSNTAGHRLITRQRIIGTGESQTRDDRAFPPDQRPGAQRAGWLTQQEQRIRDVVVTDRGHFRRWGRYAYSIARWEHITGRVAPAPVLVKEDAGPRPSPAFVEWIMGLPEGWITDSSHGLKANQQTTALGNGVLPLQAATALTAMIGLSTRH